jgi:hypothetical protein
MNNVNRRQLRTLVRGAYDVQKLRIEMGNRIVANFKAKLGQEPGKREDSIDPDAQGVLNSLRKSYRKITDGVKSFPRQSAFDGDEVISSYTELCLVAQYIALEQQEDQHFRRVGKVLTEFPIFNEFLRDVKGVGPAMAGVIISEIDIHRANSPSSIWRYAGLDVAKDGRGRSRRKEHLVEVDYTDKDGKPATRVGITFNPFLKTKLVGVLGSSFLKCKSPYRDAYDNYKHRLEHHEKHREVSKGHRHNMAVRYMVKMFLVDLYTKWRTLEGLEVRKPYHEEKLGHKHVA